MAYDDFDILDAYDEWRQDQLMKGGKANENG